MEPRTAIPQILNSSKLFRYSEYRFTYRRRPTREVMVGDIGIGGSNPIRIQSMTTSDTLDTEATIRQVIDLVNVGCEIVRITAPSIKDAENLGAIREGLRKRGINVPLVADIHFTPNAALKAAEYVEKIRINPGNYADKKKFAVIEYSENDYTRELERIEETFKPLVLKCKERGVAMRIGTNHGSLSDRIMNRYGDTPLGMVESALEFVRICEHYDYRDIVLSMKSSNTQVMIAAYRLLAARMYELGMDYPFHLGVTEAGDGEDGRIKSALGIGTLLEEGIGDTIRVSLTEDSIHEIPAARAIADKFNRQNVIFDTEKAALEIRLKEPRDPFQYHRRWTQVVETAALNAGGVHHVRVALPLRSDLHDTMQAVNEIKQLSAHQTDNPFKAEILYAPVRNYQDITAWKRMREAIEEDLLTVALIADCSHSTDMACAVLPFTDGVRWTPDKAWTADVYEAHVRKLIESIAGFEKKILQIHFSPTEIPSFVDRHVQSSSEKTGWMAIRVAQIAHEAGFSNLIISIQDSDFIAAHRILIAQLNEAGFNTPMVLHFEHKANPLFDAASHIGSLLSDGIGDVVYLDCRAVASEETVRLAYNILQAARLRVSKTEYISCPSCGRTLFDLQEVTARIKSKTGHLKGVKIAIMGCIVNGPGEMADADFGYVGASAGKINLYIGKELVERNIDMADADQKLIDLIRREGRWIEPA
ncbi:MAG TPA: (E)-4-hydroxy-3-methylbut-2-enyl-diphosphate synthase [bacterium]|nr:(E)-4-hydroxy-3-methylbut-2-enyl-diphosphate synthase [bacterium]